ncbi:MAG: IS1 family transposase [Marichromatium sp.]|nr:IS1 family transposase [Marichromatium sp.]
MKQKLKHLAGSEQWIASTGNMITRDVTAKKTPHPRGVILECDELWSLVGKRLNKQWIWLAMDRPTRRIVGVHVGDRTERSAQALWDSIPTQYQTSAPVYPDFWDTYARIIPARRHCPSAKSQGEAGQAPRWNTPPVTRGPFQQEAGEAARSPRSGRAPDAPAPRQSRQSRRMSQLPAHVTAAPGSAAARW